jgi:hypothetical protein
MIWINRFEPFGSSNPKLALEVDLPLANKIVPAWPLGSLRCRWHAALAAALATALSIVPDMKFRST